MEHSALFIFLMTIGASFVQRTVGFGFGIFIMTVLPWLLPSYGEATTLSGLLAMTTSVVIVFKMRHYLKWRKLVGILTVFALVSTVCIFCLKRMDDVLLRQILGVALVLISLYFAFFSNRIHIPSTRPYQIGTGALSGVMGGFFGMQGPPAVLYFISSTESKNEYMALMQTYALSCNIIMLIVRTYNGFLTSAVGWGYLYGLGGVAIGTALGAFVFTRIPNRIFRYIVYAYIGVSGIITLLEA
jgi:uncharacterized membrane protein YfcA